MNRRFCRVCFLCVGEDIYSRLLNLHGSTLVFDEIDFLAYAVVNATVMGRVFLTSSIKC
jgi:hypothetical protein